MLLFISETFIFINCEVTYFLKCPNSFETSTMTPCVILVEFDWLTLSFESCVFDYMKLLYLLIPSSWWFSIVTMLKCVSIWVLLTIFLSKYGKYVLQWRLFSRFPPTSCLDCTHNIQFAHPLTHKVMITENISEKPRDP